MGRPFTCPNNIYKIVLLHCCDVCTTHDRDCRGFKHLKKLSLAHNRLHGFPKLQKLPALAELRLNGNHITTIPALVP